MTRTKRQIKLETILQAALRIFAKYGFKKTTIGDIARELGAVNSALYFYVKDKRELYDKAVAYGFRRWQERVRDALAGENDPARQFAVMARKALEYLAEDEHLRSILMHDPSLFPLYPAQDHFSDINRESREMLADILANGAQAGVFRAVDCDAVVPLLFSVYVMLIQKAYMHPEAGYDEKLFEASIDLFLRGLLVKP